MGSTRITTEKSFTSVPNNKARGLGFKIRPNISQIQYRNVIRDGIGFDIDGKLVNPIKINLKVDTKQKEKE